MPLLRSSAMPSRAAWLMPSMRPSPALRNMVEYMCIVSHIGREAASASEATGATWQLAWRESVSSKAPSWACRSRCTPCDSTRTLTGCAPGRGSPNMSVQSTSHPTSGQPAFGGPTGRRPPLPRSRRRAPRGVESRSSEMASRAAAMPRSPRSAAQSAGDVAEAIVWEAPYRCDGGGAPMGSGTGVRGVPSGHRSQHERSCV